MTARTEDVKTLPLAERVAAMHRQATMVVIAILGSIVLCTAIGLYVVVARQPRLASAQLPYGLYFGAVFLAFGSIFFRRTQMRGMRLEMVAALRGIEGLLKHFFTVTVVGVALAEGIALLALVAAVQGGDQNDVARLGVVALVVALFTYPRRTSWQRAAEYFAATMPGAKE